MGKQTQMFCFNTLESLCVDELLIQLRNSIFVLKNNADEIREWIQQFHLKIKFLLFLSYNFHKNIFLFKADVINSLWFTFLSLVNFN